MAQQDDPSERQASLSRNELLPSSVSVNHSVVATFCNARQVRIGLCLLSLLVFLPGCGGCQRNRQTSAPVDGEAVKANEEGEPDEDHAAFEYSDMVVQPSELRDNAPPIQFIKPGHWITANKPIISYESDFVGVLESDCVSAKGDPLPTENTTSHLISRLEVPLARGQWRDNEVNLYVPRRSDDARGVTLRHQLLSRKGGRAIINEAQPIPPLETYQFLFVVLTDEPADYVYLRASNALVHDELAKTFNAEKLQYYQLLIPKIENRVPLPSQALAWTSIAYLVWDQPDYEKLTPDQQDALVDWIHFGGQLIVSGPDSLDKLRGSFLEPYLPARSTGSRELRSDDFADLNEDWSIPKKENELERRYLEIDDDQPLVGVQFDLHEDGAYVEGTGELVAERFVGRGRIVATAFSLDDRQFLRWQSLDGFWNGCLMRRPARLFDLDSFDDPSYRYANFQGAKNDPLLSTTLRYISRDVSTISTQTLSNSTSSANSRTSQQGSSKSGSTPNQGTTPSSNSPDPNAIDDQDQRRPAPVSADETLKREKQYGWFFGGYTSAADSGVAGWNDQSGISRAARGILRESSGITPPTSSFVLRVLVIYLVILIPVNWCFFRLIGKVEWAWVSIPVISLIGAIVVVRLASLDIGFVRSRTEVAVLEAFEGHSRGHLTRYTAVYSSLSTGYDFNFDDITSQSQPFATSDLPDVRSTDSLSEVVFERDRTVKLKDVQVDSSSVRMIHSEQMYQIDKGFGWENSATGGRFTNGTPLDLNDVGIIHRTADGKLFGGWLGAVSGGSASQKVEWKPLRDNKPWLNEWSGNDVLLSREAQVSLLVERFDQDDDGDLNLRELRDDIELFRLAQTVDRREGAARSLGRKGSRNGRLNRSEIRMLCQLRQGDDLNLGGMMEVVTKNLKLRPGETRLIGWTDDSLGQLSIEPEASQTVQRTLVVVHLELGVMPQPERDSNSWYDFVQSANNSVN